MNSGYVRVRVDGNLYHLVEEMKLEKNKHSIEVVVDRVVARRTYALAHHPLGRDRAPHRRAVSGAAMSSAVKNALNPPRIMPVRTAVSIEELRMFSFNNPYRPDCTGLGIQMKIDPDLNSDRKLSIAEGAALRAGRTNQARFRTCTMMRSFGFTMESLCVF